jgi:phenylacetic acid degradation operon negative regulatory protein
MSFVVQVGRLGDEPALVHEAWDLPTLAREYAEFLAEFENAPAAGDEAAFAALTRMVHAWRRFPFRDPGLPAALLPPDWVGQRAREVFVRRRSTWGPVAARWFAQRAGMPGITVHRAHAGRAQR